MVRSLGTGDVYTPDTVKVIHFGSPDGAIYEEPVVEE